MEIHVGLPTRNWKPQLVAPLWHRLVRLAVSAGLLWVQSRSLAAGKHHGNVTHYLSVIAADWAASFYVWLGGADPRRNPVARSGERLAPCAGWGSRSMVFVGCSWLLAVCRERSG
jgi:hypothetical protein